MRAVYLIRHGVPEYPAGDRVCLGRMDVPLADDGWTQARTLQGYFQDIPERIVVTSPLTRCRQTASVLSSEPIVCGGLIEVDMGMWTGLRFEEIRRRWPALYQRRGEDPVGVSPPGGESLADCRDRASAAFRQVLADLPHSAAVAAVAHSAVIRGIISAHADSRTFAPPPPLGSITQVLMEDGHAAAWSLPAMPEDLPSPVPDEHSCRALMEEYGTPAPVISHGAAVAEAAGEICGRLRRQGIRLNEELILAGARLHDIAKTEPRHARTGAIWLTEHGYVSAAALVGNHMRLDPEAAGRWHESSVVFLADKLVQGTARVSLEERFSAAMGGDKRPYAEIRYRQAKTLLDMLENGEPSETPLPKSGGAHTGG